MPAKTKTTSPSPLRVGESDDYLKVLEEVKKQYQQYVEVSGLYDLPIQKEGETVQYHSPSPEHPLTTNRVRVR